MKSQIHYPRSAVLNIRNVGKNMDQFENQEEEYVNYMSFGLPPEEILEALSSYKNQLVKEPFKYDNWNAADGVKFLAGIYEHSGSGDKQHLRTLANVYYETNPSLYIIRAFLERHNEFSRIWSSGDHPEKNLPNYYIEWALSKELPIDWLRPAFEQELIRLGNISAYPLLTSYAKEVLPNDAVKGGEPTKSEVMGITQKNSHLNIIGAMLELMLGQTKMGKPNSVFETQSAIVDALVEKHGTKYGISESNLNKTFPDAKKSLKSI